MYTHTCSHRRKSLNQAWIIRCVPKALVLRAGNDSIWAWAHFFQDDGTDLKYTEMIVAHHYKFVKSVCIVHCNGQILWHINYTLEMLKMFKLERKWVLRIYISECSMKET